LFLPRELARFSPLFPNFLSLCCPPEIHYPLFLAFYEGTVLTENTEPLVLIDFFSQVPSPDSAPGEHLYSRNFRFFSAFSSFLDHALRHPSGFYEGSLSHGFDLTQFQPDDLLPFSLDPQRSAVTVIFSLCRGSILHGSRLDTCAEDHPPDATRPPTPPGLPTSICCERV